MIEDITEALGRIALGISLGALFILAFCFVWMPRYVLYRLGAIK